MLQQLNPPMPEEACVHTRTWGHASHRHEADVCQCQAQFSQTPYHQLISINSRWFIKYQPAGRSSGPSILRRIYVFFLLRKREQGIKYGISNTVQVSLDVCLNLNQQINCILWGINMDNIAENTDKIPATIRQSQECKK